MIKIDISIQEKFWKTHSEISKQIKSLLTNVIQQTSLQRMIENKVIKDIEISVLLTGDQQIRELNKNYRQQDKPTNVLSFPLLDCQKIKNGNLENLNLASKHLALGDIVIAYQTVLREATEQNKTFENHLTHLIIHSLLHLIAFDHQEETDAKIMEGLEIMILEGMNITNPYI